MPLFDINAMQSIADGLKGQLERRQLSKETGDKKRALNHSVQQADRLINKQASQAERAARIDASGQETALRVGTIQKGAAINVQAARANTALNNAQRTVQTAANVAHSQAVRSVENQAAQAQHEVSRERAVGDYQTGKQLTNVARQHQHASQWNSRDQGKAIAESGIQHQAERVQSANEESVEKWQEHDELKQADIAHRLEAGSESMGRQMGQFAVQAFNSYTAGQQRAANRAYQTGRTQMHQAMQGMDASRRQEYIQSGEWRQNFADYEAKVEAIKHPFVRREAAAKMEAALTGVQAQVTSQNMQMQSKQNGVDMQEATTEADTVVSTQGPTASAGARNELVNDLHEINERMPANSRMSKDDIDKLASQTIARAELKYHMGKFDHKAVENTLNAVDPKTGKPLVAGYLSGSEVQKHREWVRRERDKATRDQEKLDDEKEQEVQDRHDSAVSHLEDITARNDFNDINNPNAVSGLSDDQQKAFNTMREAMGDGSRITNKALSKAKRKAAEGMSNMDKRRVYEFNSALEQYAKQYNQKLEDDEEGVKQQLQGNDVREKLPAAIKFSDNTSGRTMSDTESLQVGSVAVQAAMAGKGAEYAGMLREKYAGAWLDKMDEGLNTYIAKSKNKTEREKRILEANIARMDVNPQTRELVNEQELQQATRGNKGHTIPPGVKNYTPKGMGDLDRRIPSEQRDNWLRAQKEIAYYKARNKHYSDDPTEQKNGIIKEANRLLEEAAKAGHNTLQAYDQGNVGQLGASAVEKNMVVAKGMMANGRLPYIPRSDYNSKMGGVAPTRALNNIKNATIALQPDNFKALYYKHLDAASRATLDSLDSSNTPYTLGYSPQPGNDGYWNLHATTADGAAVRLRLEDGTLAGGKRKDILATGDPIPSLRAKGVMARDYVSGAQALAQKAMAKAPSAWEARRIRADEKLLPTSTREKIQAWLDGDE